MLAIEEVDDTFKSTSPSLIYPDVKKGKRFLAAHLSIPVFFLCIFIFFHTSFSNVLDG